MKGVFMGRKSTTKDRPKTSRHLSRNPHDGLQPSAFRKKGSSFKTGNSHSTITAAEQSAAYRGIDGPKKEEA
jgi:hypothetical protein